MLCQQTSPKRWFADMNIYDIILSLTCDVTNTTVYLAEMIMDRIRSGYPAGYSWFFGSGFDLDICLSKKLDRDRIGIFVFL